MCSVARRVLPATFLGDPGSKFLCEKLGKVGRKKKEQKKRRENLSKQPSLTAEIR
jgi:hypothetical protein